jgi:hypothetical protein
MVRVNKEGYNNKKRKYWKLNEKKRKEKSWKGERQGENGIKIMRVFLVLYMFLTCKNFTNKHKTCV